MYPKKITSASTANLGFHASLLASTQQHNKFQMSDTNESLTNLQHSQGYHLKMKPLQDSGERRVEKQSKIIYKNLKGKEKEEKKREREKFVYKNLKRKIFPQVCSFYGISTTRFLFFKFLLHIFRIL